MFCYTSLLVELGIFDEVNVNFLVVGHTHCNLDQNFSVLANKIHNAPYIGSPLAMRDLLSIAHKDERERPLYNIHVEVVHDYKVVFEPMVNKSLKFYQVPHRFRIRRYCGRAIFQYMLFTPEQTVTGLREDYLPHVPGGAALAAHVEALAQTETDVQLFRLGLFNGEERLMRELELATSIADSTAEQRTSKAIYDRIFEDLLDWELTSLSQQFNRLAEQRIGGDDPEASAIELRQLTKAEIQKKMLHHATSLEGFILWLDFNRPGLPEGSDYLLERPQMLPKLEAIDLGQENMAELGDEPPEVVNPRAPVAKKLASYAREIASVARKQLKKAQDGIILRTRPGDLRPIHQITNGFQDKIMSDAEFDWFHDRQTGAQVLDHLRQVQTATRAEEWVWARLSRPNMEILEATQRERIARDQAMIEHCKLVLLRKRQGVGPGVEIVARHGNADPAAAAANRDKLYKCIAGDECDSTPPYNLCEVCHVHCCALHGPDHAKHEYWAANPALIAANIAGRDREPPADGRGAAARGRHGGAAAGRGRGPGRGRGRGRTAAASGRGNETVDTVERLSAISSMSVQEMRKELREVYAISEQTLQKHTGNLGTLLRLKRLEAGNGTRSQGRQSVTSAGTASVVAAAPAGANGPPSAPTGVTQVVHDADEDEDEDNSDGLENDTPDDEYEM